MKKAFNMISYNDNDNIRISCQFDEEQLSNLFGTLETLKEN